MYLNRVVSDLKIGLPVRIKLSTADILIFAVDVDVFEKNYVKIPQKLLNDAHLLISADRMRFLCAGIDFCSSSVLLSIKELYNNRAINDPDLICGISGCTLRYSVLENNIQACVVSAATRTLEALLDIARSAQLLPSFLLLQYNEKLAESFEVPLTTISEEFFTTVEKNAIDYIETCKAPLLLNLYQEKLISAEITLYNLNSLEHYLVSFAGISRDHPPLVRIHSACFTGDVLNSAKCDCNLQLKRAMEMIGQSSFGGAIVYLNQEGRGIGLKNKLRAYWLQDHCSIDTVEANLALGFTADGRNFSSAAAILRSAGLTRIKLITNNPHKVSAMVEAGIDVVESIPLLARDKPELAQYYKAKATKLGHLTSITAE